MKKIYSILAAILLCSVLMTGLAACGGTQDESGASTNGTEGYETPAATKPAPTEPPATEPTQEPSTEPPVPVYEFHLRSGENRFITGRDFDGKVIVDGDGATITFNGCSFSDNILNNAAEYTRIYLSEDCELAEGVIAEIHSGVQEATLDYALPKIVTSIPLTVECDGLGAVYGKPGVQVCFNGKDYTEADMEVIAVNGVLFPIDSDYQITDGYLVSHWWENGEEVFFLKGECTVGGKDAPVLFTLDPQNEQLIGDQTFTGPVYVDGHEGTLRFENCIFQNTLTVLATGNAAAEEENNCSHLSLNGCDLGMGLEARGSGLEMSLTGCTLRADVVNSASEFTRVKLLDGCSFHEGVRAVVKSGIREANVDYALPKIYLSTPLEAVCEDLGGIFLLGEFEEVFNGRTYTSMDINHYTMNGEVTTHDGTIPLAHGYLIAHWWENGEEIMWISADNEHQYTLDDLLGPEDPRRAAYNDYPNLGIFVDPVDVKKTSGYVNVRKTPEIGDNLVGELLPFNAVNIIGEEGDFYKVNTGSLKGVYVAKRYIMTGEDAKVLALNYLTQKVKVKDPEGVYMRRTPTTATSENRITLLRAGTEFTFSDTVNGEDGRTWVKIYYGDEESGEGGQHSPVYGYVRSDVVSIEYAMQTAISLLPVSYFIPSYPDPTDPAPPVDPGSDVFQLPNDPCRRALVQYAMHWLGTPYVWAGTTLGSGVDCSGFVLMVYSDVLGISLPHYSASQATYGRQISADELQAGDLIFYAPGGGTISHVVMYIGNGLFIHASTDAGCVTITNYFNYLTPVKIMTLQDAFPSAPRQSALDKINSWG